MTTVVKMSPVWRSRAPKIKRYEVAGRKAILYLEDLVPGETVDVEFDAPELHPVRTQPVTSQVYSYYNPQWRGETLGKSVTVEEKS